MTSTSTATAVDKAFEFLGKPEHNEELLKIKKEVIFLNMDETPTRFSYETPKGHCYALKESVQLADLPPTEGQVDDTRKFSALCYHSTSESFNEEVLLGGGDARWGSMSMFAMPPGNGQRNKMEAAIANLQK